MLFVILLVVASVIAVAITRNLQAQSAKNETVITVKEVKTEPESVVKESKSLGESKTNVKETKQTKKQTPAPVAKTSAKKK